MQSEIQTQVRAYYVIWQETNAVYAEWARSRGLSYNSLFTLYALWQNPQGCTQKQICEQWILTKQTVSTILQDFEKRGLISFTPLPGDRRNKTIHLTEEGVDLANRMIGQLSRREEEAMSRMGEEERAALLRSSSLFLQYFKEGFEKQNQ